MFVLDTNTVIYFFKGMGGVAARLRDTPPREVAVSAITAFELRLGVAKTEASEPRKAERERVVETFLRAMAILPFHDAEAAQAARVRAELERRGAPIGPYDILIAATALAHGAVLVTHNLREFSRVPGLLVEDWW